MSQLEVLSAQYGHKAVFYTTDPLAASHLDDVTWGLSSISVPSTSPLNGPAHVWLDVPRVNIASAKRWCARNKLRFLAAWQDKNDSYPRGFCFTAPGFSRYRYEESDSEEDQPGHAGASVEQPDEAHAPHAASTPARRKIQMRSESVAETPGQQNSPRPETPLYARPRMATPRAAFLEEGDDGDDEDGDDGNTREELARRPALSPERLDDGLPDTDGENTDPADGAVARDKTLMVTDPWQDARAVDEQEMQRMRAALFEELPSYSPDGTKLKKLLQSEALRRASGIMNAAEDANMEDVDQGECDDPYEAEEKHFGMFVSPGRVQGYVDAEDLTGREAGNFAANGETRGRQLHGENLFPARSLPFPAINQSVMAGKEDVFFDTGLMLGRCRRASLGNHCLLARPWWQNASEHAFGTEGFVVSLHDVYEVGTSLPRRFLASFLRVHCATWHTDWNQNDAHTSREELSKAGTTNLDLRMPNLRNAFARHGEVADLTVEDIVDTLKICHAEGDANALHAQIVFWLLLALYKSDDDAAFPGASNLLKRLAEWSVGPAGTAFEDDEHSGAVGLRSALLSLSLGKIEDAVSAAVEAGHLRLSLLIARAMESPKDDLRRDAEEQLSSYGLMKSPLKATNSEDNTPVWDGVLEECTDDALVTTDEIMILLVLAGQVAPVARYLNLSWYRLFIMELLFGAGSSDLTQAERVSAAVDAVEGSGISTVAPHGRTGCIDVVYHVLRLYADPTASYSLATGVYSSGSFGTVYAPLDVRFSWLLYQVLTALVPQAAVERAPLMLADAFASQLRASKLHLWSLYVLCSGGAGPDVIKTALIRDWPDIANDFVEWNSSNNSLDGDMRMDGGEEAPNGLDEKSRLDPQVFIKNILGIPNEWVSEAKAVAALADGDKLGECEHWIASGSEHGALRAHDVLVCDVFPDVVAAQDSSKYDRIALLLRQLKSSKYVSNWFSGGGLILDYLDHIVGMPTVQKQSVEFYRSMVQRVKALKERARTPSQHHAVSVIADGIAAIERTKLMQATPEERESLLNRFVDDLEELPCTKSAKLRVAGEYRVEAEHGHNIAVRFSAAYPPYARYLEPNPSGSG